ncbi:hypothetical protein GCM10009678_61610 [Actinomadura kijaniata]|uniref:hypothetical protein n=1 Tax=Actinomadura kijaniata TaxID=46161 RepID=UPI002FEAEC3D
MGLRRGVVVGYGLLVAAMALVTVDVLADGPLRQLDFALHRLCARHVRGVWWEVANAVTQLGQRGVLLQAIVPLAVVAAIRRRSPRPPLAAALIIVVLSCLQVTLKAQIPRTFPFGDTDVIFAQGNAYPSGHTLNAILLVWVILELLALALPAAAARPAPAQPAGAAVAVHRTGTPRGAAVAVRRRGRLHERLSGPRRVVSVEAARRPPPPGPGAGCAGPAGEWRSRGRRRGPP